MPRLFLLIAGSFGLAIVFATPPDGASDEIAQQFKIVRVASGNPFGADRALRLPDIVAWYGPFTDLAMLDTQHRFGKRELRAVLQAPLTCAPVTLAANDALAAYGPLSYLPQALAYRASCAAGTSFGAYLHAARIANLVVALALTAGGIALAGSAGWVLFAVALLPATMLQLASVSGDAMLFGLCFALIGLVLAIVGRRLAPGSGVALICAAGVAIACTKPGYAWLSGIALVTLPRYRDAGWNWRTLAAWFIALPVAVQAGVIVLSQGALPVAPGVDSAEQMRLLRTDVTHFLQQLAHVPAAWPLRTQWSVLDTLIGLPVWMDTRLSEGLSVALAGGLALAMLMSREPGLTGRMRTWLALLACLSVVLVALPLYLFATPTANEAIFGLQGRYFTPTLAILLSAGPLRLPRPVSVLLAPILVAIPCIALPQAVQLVRWRYFGS